MFSLWLSILFAQSFAQGPRIIHPDPSGGDYKEVVLLNGMKKCAATVIGPRTVVTAAKCIGPDLKASFELGGVTYNLQMTKSPNLTKLHDMALGFTDKKIEGVTPAYIGQAPSVGQAIKIAGYGCSTEGGGESDLTLKVGSTKITGVSGFDFTSQDSNGAAICPGGDEGGPAFSSDTSKHFVIGINRTSNLKDKNYHISLQAPESLSFFNSFLTQSQSPICGISPNCGEAPVNPPECRLTANPNVIKKGGSLTLTLEILSGQVTSATIDNVPVTAPTQKVITPQGTGDLTSTATIKGPTGENTCTASYHVDSNIDPTKPPSCELIASPKRVKPNQPVTLELKTSGNVTQAKIDETTVSPQGGKKTVTKSGKGIYTAAGLVIGPDGSAACATYYEVNDGNDPLPSLPNFAVIGTLCGDNALANSMVKKVCLGTLKKDSTIPGDLKVSDILQLTYQNGNQEVMAVIGKIKKPVFTATVFEELWLFYSNKFLNTGTQLELDTRTATAAVDQSDGSVRKLSGRSATGEYFVVENLTPVFTKKKP